MQDYISSAELVFKILSDKELKRRFYFCLFIYINW